MVTNSYRASYEGTPTPGELSFVDRLHAKAREEAMKRRMAAAGEHESATHRHLNTLKKGSSVSSSKMAPPFKNTEICVEKFDGYMDVHYARVNNKRRGVRDFKLSPIQKKNIKQGGVADNNVFRGQTVTVAPSSTIGQQSGGYVGTYRHRILEERQRNKAEKSLQQKALDNKRMNATQYSDEVRRKAKMRAARRAQLHIEISAETSNINALSNVQVQVQNNPYQTTAVQSGDYHSSLMTRRKQLITTESERIRQQKAARDQANQRMRQRFSKRREIHTTSNTTSGGGTAAIVKPQDVRAIGEERPPALNEVVPFQSSGVNKQFLYEKRLTDIESKVYGHRMAYANRYSMLHQTSSSSQPPTRWNNCHHTTGKDKTIAIDTTATTTSIPSITEIHRRFHSPKAQSVVERCTELELLCVRQE